MAERCVRAEEETAGAAVRVREGQTDARPYRWAWCGEATLCRRRAGDPRRALYSVRGGALAEPAELRRGVGCGHSTRQWPSEVVTLPAKAHDAPNTRMLRAACYMGILGATATPAMAGAFRVLPVQYNGGHRRLPCEPAADLCGVGD